MTIAYVADVEAGGTGTPNGVTTGAINTTGANFCAQFLADYTPGSGEAFSDNKGNSYSALAASENTNVRAQFAYAENATTGTSHTFSVSGTGIYPTLGAIACSGVKTSGSFDQQNGAVTGGASTTIQPGSVTPTENNELVLTGVCFGQAASVTVNLGFTEIADIAFSSGNYFQMGLAYEIQTTATARNPTWTSGTSEEGAARIATFKAQPTAMINKFHGKFAGPFIRKVA